MMKARIVKTAIDFKADKTFLIGVAETEEEALNFSVQFELEDLALFDEWINELRNKIAEEFDIHTWEVEIDKQTLLDKMLFWNQMFHSMEVH